MTSCEAFLLYFLAKSPRVQKKLYEEIVSVIPNAESSITETNLQDMPYLRACLKESLRYHNIFISIKISNLNNFTMRLHFSIQDCDLLFHTLPDYYQIRYVSMDIQYQKG